MSALEKLDSIAENFDISGTNLKTLDGMFLLIIAVLGNFTGETLSCKLQKTATNNVYVKQFIILLMVYFTINFTSATPAHPWEALKKTLLIWIGFLMFAKQSSMTTGIISVLLVFSYMLENNIQYYKHTSLKESKSKGDANALMLGSMYLTQSRMKYIQKYVFAVTLITLITGFLLYLKDKRQEYGDNFEWASFMFGIPVCNGIK